MSRRILTDDEHALWDSVAKSAKPLKKPRRKKLETLAVTDTADPPRIAVKPARAAPKTKPPVKPPAAPPLTQMTRRERSRVARGRSEIDARLDLHGKTLIQAQGILLRFLQRAQAEGAVIVLVITGKGRAGGAEREIGALRREVPHWLTLPEFRVLVAGFETAHVGHGGEGALYVRLRRAR